MTAENIRTLRRAEATLKRIEAADIGKIRYVSVGPGVVSPAVREAAERARELFYLRADPGLSGIKIVFMREESAKSREYFEQYPQDRGDPEIDDTIDVRDNRVAGLAKPFSDEICIHADLSVEQAVRTVAHELQHKRQALDMDIEEREQDARQVAERFIERIEEPEKKRQNFLIALALYPWMSFYAHYFLG